MLKTYKALLKNDHLEWLEPPPATNGGELLVDVSATLVEEHAHHSPPAELKSGAKMVAALEKLVQMGGLSDIIPDPVQWQRALREDGQLSGRN